MHKFISNIAFIATIILIICVILLGASVFSTAVSGFLKETLIIGTWSLMKVLVVALVISGVTLLACAAIDPEATQEGISRAGETLSSLVSAVVGVIGKVASAAVSAIPTWVWLAGGALLYFTLKSKNGTDVTVVAPEAPAAQIA